MKKKIEKRKLVVLCYNCDRKVLSMFLVDTSTNMCFPKIRYYKSIIYQYSFSDDTFD